MGIPYTIFSDTFIYIFSMAYILFILFIVFHSCSIFFYGANMDSSHSVQCSTVVPFFPIWLDFHMFSNVFLIFFPWIFHILPVHLVANLPWSMTWGLRLDGCLGVRDRHREWRPAAGHWEKFRWLRLSKLPLKFHMIGEVDSDGLWLLGNWILNYVGLWFWWIMIHMIDIG